MALESLSVTIFLYFFLKIKIKFSKQKYNLSRPILELESYYVKVIGCDNEFLS